MNYNFTINRNRVYCALKYKIENDTFYTNVNIDSHALDDIKRNIDCNIFHQMRTVHVDVDNEPNEIVNVTTMMEEVDDNNINHSTSMVTRLVNLQKEMEFIHAWVNNPNIDP